MTSTESLSETLIESVTVKVKTVVMDGEAVLINLGTGLYYSMDNAGGVMWALIEQQRSIGEAADVLARLYGIGRERARADALALAEELLAEGLVLQADGAPASAHADPALFEDWPYETPRLQTYRDMTDLLALDPPMPGLKEAPWRGPVDALPEEPGDEH